MFFNIIEKAIRVTKSLKEPRVATKDVTHETMHHSPIFRGKHKISYELCIGCDACNKICPVDAIKMKSLPIKKPRIIPEVNLAICIFCGLCEDVCPTKPEKAIKLSGGTFEMITENGDHKTLTDYWVRVDVPEEWIEARKKEEAEKEAKRKAKREALIKGAANTMSKDKE